MVFFPIVFHLSILFPSVFSATFATKKTSYRNAVSIVFSLCSTPAVTFPSRGWSRALCEFPSGRALNDSRQNAGKAAPGAWAGSESGDIGRAPNTPAFSLKTGTIALLSCPLFQITLPLGISFFTFRTVLSHRLPPSSSRTGTFHIPAVRSFSPSPFPDLSHDMRPCRHTCTSAAFRRTISASVSAELPWDLPKRSCWQTGFRHRRPVPGERFHQTTLGVWYGVVLYALQMYFDFSGYSIWQSVLHAFSDSTWTKTSATRSCARISRSSAALAYFPGDFFPGLSAVCSAVGKRRKIGGLLLVWFCTGLWHGASWNYIIWGIYYGLFLMLEMGIGKKGMKKIPAVIRHICNKIGIVVGFGIFYCTGGIDQLGDMLLAMAGQNGTGWYDTMLVTSVQNNLFLLIAALLCCFPLLELPKKWMAKNPAVNLTLSVTGTVLAAGLLIVSSILMVDATNTPFLYTKF